MEAGFAAAEGSRPGEGDGSLSWLPFELGHPWVLLLGVAAGWWTVAIARRSLAGQSRFWLRFSLILRLVLIVVLTLALADIRVTWRSDELRVLFVVDVSASMPVGEVTGEGGILDRLAELGKLPRDTRAGVILFGSESAVHYPLADRLRRHLVETVIDGEATDIASALRLADVTFTHEGAEGGRRIVVISDGNVTHGDELREGKNLAATGTVVDVLPVSYEYRNEILLDSVQVPTEVHPEEPYLVTAVIHTEQDTRVRVQLYENDVQVGPGQTVEVSRGKTRVDFPLLHSEAGHFRYEVRIFPEDGSKDTLARNNVGHGFTLIRGSSRVLFIGDGQQHSALLGALRSSAIDVEVTDPLGIPSRPEDYFLYDTIMVADVPAYELGIDSMRLLQGVVKNLGLGFVMIGGPDSFGAGGYKGTPIEKLLPVEMDIKQRKILPNGALALVLHTCEFANGNMWAKRIATSAIDILNDKDYVGILLWGGRGADSWGVAFDRVGRAGGKAGIIAQIRNLQPADMPSFVNSMNQGLAALQGASAHTKHMVIISDGDPAPPSRALIQQFQAARISVTTICINPHGGRDTGMMKLIAQQTKGRYYLVRDPRQLPQIFMREALQVHRSLITEEDFTPAVAVVSEVVTGLGDEGFPELHGYVLTTAKPLAETSLVSHTQDPILSIWRYGLGRTAAFTSDGGGRWASDWVGWSGYEPFWAQLVRSVARRGGDEIFRYDCSLDGDRGRIILDAIDAEGHYLDDLGISGRVMSPKFDEEKVTFQQTGPGRYEAEFQARQAGTYLVALDYERADGVRGSTQAGVTVSYSPEYRNLSSDVARLEALAAATGGRVLDWEDDFFDRKELPAQLHRLPQFELLLQLLLLLFFADIVFRRVIFSMAPVARLVARFRSRPVPVADEASTRLLGTLLEKRKQLRPQGERTVIQVKESTEASGGGPVDAGRRDAAAGEHPSGERSETREASFTDRLLEAKRRAQSELNRRDED